MCQMFVTDRKRGKVFGLRCVWERYIRGEGIWEG